LVVFAVHLATLELLRTVDAHGDVRALRRNGDLHAAGVAVEALFAAVEADVLDNLAHQIVEVHKGRGRDLAQAHDKAGLDRGLTRHTRGRVLLHDRVEHRIADLVAHLVRVAFRHGLAREEKAWGSHKGSHFDRSPKNNGQLSTVNGQWSIVNGDANSRTRRLH